MTGLKRLECNLPDDYSVKMVFRSSLIISLGQLANIKQGEQSKNYKLTTSI